MFEIKSNNHRLFKSMQTRGCASLIDGIIIKTTISWGKNILYIYLIVWNRHLVYRLLVQVSTHFLQFVLFVQDMVVDSYLEDTNTTIKTFLILELCIL